MRAHVPTSAPDLVVSKMWWYVVTLFLMEASLAAHPECTWQCDDPICAADCIPVCEAPVCTYMCEPVDDITVTCKTPQCHVSCPADQAEMDACPQCETICAPLKCKPAAVANCSILCEETECSWWCVTPSDCPRPICELQCEAPACEGEAPSDASRSREVGMWDLLFILSLFTRTLSSS